MKQKSVSRERMTKDTVILLMSLFYPAVHNYFWRAIIAFTGLDRTVFTIEVFDAIIWAILIGYMLATASRAKMTWRTYFAVILFIFVAVASFMLTEYKYFTSTVLWTLLIGGCVFFLQGSLINMKNVSYNQLLGAAKITLVISTLYSLYTIISKNATYEDNMDFSYRALPAVLIVFSGLLVKKAGRSTIVFAAMGVVLLLLQGTRGPLLCLAVYVCLMLYKKHGMGKFFLKVSAAVLIVTLLLSSQTIQNWLLNVSEQIDSTGYSSRFISMLVKGELSDDNGRDVIKEALLEEIQENPFQIRGMFADRQATRGLRNYEWNIIYPEGTYAHSIWIEVIFDWGLLLGGVLLISIVLILFRTIKKCSMSDAYIVMLFVCTGFVHLFLSGSYLEDTGFFFLMGLTMNDSAVLRTGTGRYQYENSRNQYANKWQYGKDNVPNCRNSKGFGAYSSNIYTRAVCERKEKQNG